MARPKKPSSDSPQTRGKRTAADKSIAETSSQKRVATNKKQSVETNAIEGAYGQSEQTLSGKTENKLQEDSIKMKSKQSSGQKGTKAQVRKLRAVSSTPPPGNLEEEIRIRAYEISLESPHDPVANWLKAEAEIKAKYQIAVNQ